MRTALFPLLVLLVTALLAAAHVGRGLRVPAAGEFRKRAAPALRFARGDPKSEEEERKISSAEKQCHGYDYESQSKLRKKYPKDNHIASIVDGDEDAQKVWDDIKSSGIIPDDVEVRSSTDGHMGITDSENDDYSDDDPDCWWTASKCTKPKHDKLNPDVSTCPEKGTWGLTFDDGPNCSHNAFYDFLQQHKLKATMFFIGANVMDWPYQAQRALVDGHDICVHTWSHKYMTTLANDNVFAELYYTARIIKDVMGVTPRCWRPPYGDVDDRVRAIAHGLGLRTILWEDDTSDWDIKPDETKPTASIDANYKSIMSKQTAGKYSTAGPIILTHEISNATMTEFERMYSKMKKSFKHIVPVTACLNVTRPYAEDTLTYPSFMQFIGGSHAKGLPKSNELNITADGDMHITPESKQSEPGGFSPQSPKSRQLDSDHLRNRDDDDDDDDDKGGGKSSGMAVVPNVYVVAIIVICMHMLIG